MNFPSGDQSCGVVCSDDLSSNSSLPVPFAFLSYKFETPLRFDAKTIWLPSGDHVGAFSLPGSKVNRERLFRARSISQRSEEPPCRSSRLIASRFSSGERRGQESALGFPTNESCLPARSNHAS